MLKLPKNKLKLGFECQMGTTVPDLRMDFFYIHKFPPYGQALLAPEEGCSRQKFFQKFVLWGNFLKVNFSGHFFSDMFWVNFFWKIYFGKFLLNLF